MKRWIAAFAVVSAIPVLMAQARVQNFGASLEESSWSAEGNVLKCSLSQEIPYYGKAVFNSYAGGDMTLTFELEREQPHKSDEAALRSMPPPWKHQSQPFDIAKVSLRPGPAPVTFGREAALRALYELEQGMFPTLTYKDWADARDQVNVSISAVKLRTALQDFNRCTAGLHPDGFADVDDRNLYFGSDEWRLSDKNKHTLDRIVSYMGVDPDVSHVIISGHADSQGDKYYNEEMSQLRVDAVREYLISKGLSEDILVTLYYGAKRPVASNRTEQGRAKNRRVHVALKK